MLKCSVVIPTYNRARLLHSTLESLVGQSLPVDQFEVLVVDDGSSDSTRSVVESFQDRLDVRYFFQEDKGFRAALARNVGIGHARSEICVFLDSGMVVHSGCLAAHVESHAVHDGPVAVLGYVYCLMLDADDEAAERMAGLIDFSDPDGSIALLERRGLWPDVRDDYYAKYGDDFAHLPAPWVIYWTCNVSANTAQLHRVGMFDEAFQGWGGEDLDLAYRLHRAGAHFLLNRRAVGIHAPHEKAAKHETESGNYEYIAGKYRTPISSLVLGFTTLEITPMNINDVIIERGLPSCADHDRQVGVR